MKVITNNPILVNSKRVEPTDMYLNLDAKGARKAARAQKKGSKPKDGRVWDKTKGAWVKAQDSGVLSSLGTMFGLNTQPVYDDQPYVDYNDPNANQQPMNPGLKTGLIIGGVVLAGVAVYFLMRSPKSGK